MRVYRRIHVTSNWFLNNVTYRFQYAAFTDRRFIDEEGESIVYVTPSGIDFLKVDGLYRSLQILDSRPHELKAKAIVVLKERRKQRYFLKLEGKPKWDETYKNPPRKKKTHK